MCGIVGILDFKNKIDEKLIKRMADSIKHRGPDDEGYFFDKNIGLGHRRLSIIDLKTGHQPIFNENKTICIVYNGEIYNFIELREKLEKNNHKFYTNSDTEVIIHAYEEWGEKCVKRFNGQFAFAIWDSKKKRLFVARDRIGIKPLYYYSYDEKFIFASEIKAILQDKMVKRRPDDEIIYDYLSFGLHDHKEKIFFKGIKRLMPAHYMIVTKEERKIVKYWNLEIKENETPEKFYELFENSVKSRLISEVPVGTLLSGGLDSSSIICIVDKMLVEGGFKDTLGKKQKTFSAVFNDKKIDESKWINEVIKKTKIEKNDTFPTCENLKKELKELIYSQEEPVGNLSIYPQFCVMREASKKVKVLLSGEGGDELLAGYIPYYGIYLMELLRKKMFFRLIKEFLFSFDLTYPLFKYFFKRTRSRNELLNKDFSYEYKNLKKDKWKIKRDLNKTLYLDVTKYCLPHLLRYDDKLAMTFSVEVRVPFLDHRLVEYLFSLPVDMKLRNGWTKHILRESTKGVIPEKIRKRRSKYGFETPEVRWTKEMKDLFKEIFESESFGKRKYFNQKNILKEFDSFCKGKKIQPKLFWRALNLELWMRIFIDKGR